jgi:hypothetical protein
VTSPAPIVSLRYPAPSSLGTVAGVPRLSLVTSEARDFFTGAARAPRELATSILLIGQVARSRFHTPPGMLARILLEADPVVNVGDSHLRFEAFSACCGVYGRADVPNGALDGAWTSQGTTNVDLGAPMRAALVGVVDGQELGLAVGADHLTVRADGGEAVERQITLPRRWLRGFLESAAIQAGMTEGPMARGAQVVRFLRSLPRSATRGSVWVTSAAGTGLRVSATPSPGALRAGGLERLRLLERAASQAVSLQVWGDDSGCTAWRMALTHGGAITLLLGPEGWRGLSGEGRSLEHLERSPHQGFDLGEGRWFPRELPYGARTQAELQPRLQAAQELVAAVRLTATEAGFRAEVPGTGTVHHVVADADGVRCTCPWYAKHSGERGPCKHVLAAQWAADA